MQKILSGVILGIIFTLTFWPKVEYDNLILRVPDYQSTIKTPGDSNNTRSNDKPKVAENYRFRSPIILPGIPLPPLSAEAFAVYDLDTSQSIIQQSTVDIWPLASLTKLAVAIAAVKANPDWDQIYTVQNIPEVNGRGVQFVYPGDRLSLHDALAAALISSDNLAAANIVSWLNLDFSDFTATYPTLNLSEYTGLSAANTASLEDIISLGRDAWSEDMIRDLSSRSTYTIQVNDKPIKLDSTNPLLTQDANWLASKTGYLPASRGNVMALRRFPDGHQVLLVILGADSIISRFTELDALKTWAEQSIVW